MERRSVAGAFFDDSLWPPLVIRFVGALSNAQHEEYLVRSASYFQHGERHIAILDMSQATNIAPPDRRQRQAEWFDTHESCASRCSVSPSSSARPSTGWC